LGSKICSNCAERKLHFVAGVSAFRYQGLMKELLARYKYGRDQYLKQLLQQLIVRALQEKRLQEIVFAAVVPVPLYPLRERERGFNQALPLAEEVARSKQIPLRLLLKRVTPTVFQAASNRQKRLQNLEHAFALRRPTSLHGNYLLVDDVLTTGATLECAKILLQAGADGVWAVTLAR
jgi:ComF family protein